MNENDLKKATHILIVDDNPEDVRIYCRKLAQREDLEYQISDVATGGEGLAFIRQHPVDCVLLDYRLPDMDGLEFLSELNRYKLTEVFPIILLTGQGDEQVAVQAMKSGAADYLIKGSLNSDLLFRTISNAMDKTRQKQEQKRYYNLLKTLIDTVPNPLFFKDRQGRYTGCNRAFETLVGKTKSEVVGRTWYDLYPQSLADKCNEAEATLFQSSTTQTCDLKIPCADGEVRDMICYLARYQEVGRPQEGLVGVFLDISAQKQTEAELRHTQEELEAAVRYLKDANRRIMKQQKSAIEDERLKVLLQMAGATAHELNQPLMALQIGIDLIRGRSEIDPKDLERIETAGEKIADIVRKIQNIRHDQVVPLPGCKPIIKIDQTAIILVVEDNKADHLQLNALTKEIGNIELIHAATQSEAFDLLQEKSIDMILLDYMLPDGTGLEFMELLKQRQLEIPVVIITGGGNEVLASQSIQAGAYDYLPKSQLGVASLARIINHTMEKKRFKHELKKVTDKMAQMTRRDELTGLYNRRYFNKSLQQEVGRAKRYGRALALAIFDLDYLKRVCDVHGEAAGDYVLQEIGILILKLVRDCDIACRYGGDKLAVIMPETDLEHSMIVCNRIREAVHSLSLEFDGTYFSVTVSGGVALYTPDPDRDINAFIQSVEHLVSQAKTSGRNQVIASESPNNPKTTAVDAGQASPKNAKILQSV